MSLIILDVILYVTSVAFTGLFTSLLFFNFISNFRENKGFRFSVLTVKEYVGIGMIYIIISFLALMFFNFRIPSHVLIQLILFMVILIFSPAFGHLLKECVKAITDPDNQMDKITRPNKK